MRLRRQGREADVVVLKIQDSQPRRANAFGGTGRLHEGVLGRRRVSQRPAGARRFFGALSPGCAALATGLFSPRPSGTVTCGGRTELGRSEFVVSHPFRDEAAKWMGHRWVSRLDVQSREENCRVSPSSWLWILRWGLAQGRWERMPAAWARRAGRRRWPAARSP